MSRSSSSRRISAAANGSPATSSSGGPRHSASASRGAAGGHEPLEARDVEVVEPELVAVPAGHDRRGPERLAQLGHVELDQLTAVAGGCSPHRPSIRRSDETVDPAWSASSASRARGFPAPTATGRPSTLASTGPRSRTSIASQPGRHYTAVYRRCHRRSTGPRDGARHEDLSLCSRLVAATLTAEPRRRSLANGRIVFDSDREGLDLDIWTMRPDGSRLVNLTPDGSNPPGAPGETEYFDAQRELAPRRAQDRVRERSPDAHQHRRRQRGVRDERGRVRPEADHVQRALGAVPGVVRPTAARSCSDGIWTRTEPTTSSSTTSSR